MVLIFDLDDTLYDEMTFVRSGLLAVARFGESAYGWPADQSFAHMLDVLAKQGRGKVFDEWLVQHGKLSKARVAQCVHVYRHHTPRIELFREARSVLARYQGKAALYLVTDGHKIVQQNKVVALGLQPVFKRVFITHRFGVRNAKPSLHCFDIIRRTEGCAWTDMVYVGDNPAKDFVGLNAQGALTVRVLTGSHRHAIASAGHDGQIALQDLNALPQALRKWRHS